MEISAEKAKLTANNTEIKINGQKLETATSMIDALPCHINLPVCLWIMDPHSKAKKKEEYKPWK